MSRQSSESDLEQLTNMLKRIGHPVGVLKPAGPGASSDATQSLFVFDKDDSSQKNGAAWWAHFSADGRLISIATIPDTEP